MSRIAVIGVGYVGLTTGVCLAHLGHDVICADIDEDKIERLRRGEVPMLETSLDRLLAEGLRRRRLQFVVGASHAVADAEFACLCVPTPFGVDGAADLGFLRAACLEIAPLLKSGAIVMNKSTVPVGTAHMVEQIIGRDDITVVSNPEFLREGYAVQDFLHPDRIVIGSDNEAAAVRVAALYFGVSAPLIVTDSASAEMIKYAANSFLAMKISFVNSIASICEGVGADITDVVRGVGYDRRVGPDCLKPGPGWGGSCLPKDTAALLRISQDSGYDFALLRAAVASNEEQRSRVLAKVRRAVGGCVEGRRIAVWGLTFKANTSDLRDSPALDVIRRLREEGAHVVAYDPSVTNAMDGVDVVADPYGPCDGADVLLVMTEWDEFQQVDFDKVSHLLYGPAVVDARNMLDPDDVRAVGLSYTGIGR